MKQQVNLYLPEFRKRKDPLGLANMLAVLGAVAGLCALLSAWQYWQLRSLEGELSVQREQLAQATARTAQLMESLGQRSADRTLAGSVQRLEEELQSKQVFLSFLDGRDIGNTNGFSGHLADLSRYLVPGLRLTRIDLSQGGRQVQLGGEVTRPENVPLYLQSLSRGHAYTGRSFETLRITEALAGGMDGLLGFEVATRTGGR